MPGCSLTCSLGASGVGDAGGDTDDNVDEDGVVVVVVEDVGDGGDIAVDVEGVHLKVGPHYDQSYR